MTEDTTFVGLDVHKDSIAVAYTRQGGEPVALGTIPNKKESVVKVLGRLGPYEQLSCCYEAGPCGYVLYRQMMQLGVKCKVVAPSLVPVKPGDQVKTDRRDAMKLARLLSSGVLTAVWVPDEQHEALRDLTMARDAAKQDLGRHRNQLGKFLLRWGVHPPEGMRVWGPAHKEWIRSMQLPMRAQQLVLGEYLHCVEQAEELVKRLEKDIAEVVATNPLQPLTANLQALRGIKLVSSAGMVGEMGDVGRFSNPRQVMGYVGLGVRSHPPGRAYIGEG